MGGSTTAIKNVTNELVNKLKGTAKSDVQSEFTGVTNAVSKPLDSYPEAKRNTIQSFVGAVDQKIKSFAQSVKAGDKNFRREKISDVSSRAVSDISALLGIDVSGYTNNINTNGMQHIINRHGENGTHDSTMAIDDDIARIGWVLDNYDSVEQLTENGEQVYSSEFRDKNDNPAPQIRFVKKIDGSYYVVEAACENRYQKLWVQSAYLQKNEDVTQAPAEGYNTNHETNARSALASPSSLTSIAENALAVNGEDTNTSVQSLRELAQQKVDDEYAAAYDGQVLDDEIPSTEGKVLRGKTAVEIADIESAGGGKLQVKLTDGSTADVAELSFPDAGEQELWRVIGEYAENAEAARLLLKEFRAGNLDAYKFARGAEEGFLYGMANISPSEMATRGSYVNLLDPMQRNMAYKQGQIAGERKARQRQEKIQAGKQKSSNKKGQLHFEGDRNSLTKRQRVSLQACEVIAKALSIQVYVFESERVNGKRVGDNGWYDPKDGSIHIDLHAGENAEGVMVFTLAHELGHFIKDWSPVKFRTLSKFLAEQYAKKGESVDLLVRRQQKKAEADGRKLSYEEAHEEWVCDSLETMLTDGTVLEKLSILQAKDAGLVEKIKSFLDQFVKKLKAAYEGIRPQTVEGQIVSELVDAAQELQELFADALIDAGENFQKAEKNTTGEGGVRYSHGYVDQSMEGGYDFTKSFAEQLNDYLDGKFPRDQSFIVGVTPENLLKIGLAKLPVTMDVTHVSYALEGTYPGSNERKLDHTIPKADLENIIKKLSDPVAVIQDRQTWQKKPSGYSIDVLIDMEINGKKALIPINVNQRAYANKTEYDSNKLTTVHGDVDTVKRLANALNEHNKDNIAVFYVNKEKANEFLQPTGHPISSTAAKLDGFIARVTDKGSNVKMRIASVLESRQFKQWFGDWVKHPDKASKIVNQNGTPKVVYHGSADMFDTFSYGHIGSASGVSFLGDGFYFTDKKKLAKNYGENVYECYLQMKKPYYAQENEAYKLNRKALEKQGYDGVILNAPTGTIYMVFNNTQIKSATDNIGTFDGENPNIRYSSRSGSVSDRAMLVDLFEQMVTDSNEYKALQNYKKNMDRMMALEEKVQRLTDEIKRISFSEGPRDMEYLNNLKWQRKQAVAELNKYDNILLGLEKSGVLRAMIERNRKVITQKSYDEAREYYREKNETREAEIRQYYRESRRQAVERHDKAQVRQQIRKDVQRLDSLLNKGTKEKNVKLELRGGRVLRKPCFKIPPCSLPGKIV